MFFCFWKFFIFNLRWSHSLIAWLPQKRELRLKLAQQSSSQWSFEQASLVFNLLELNSEPAGSSKNMAQLPTRVFRFYSEQNFEELNKRLSLSSQTYIELSIFFSNLKIMAPIHLALVKVPEMRGLNSESDISADWGKKGDQPTKFLKDFRWHILRRKRQTQNA